MAEPVELVGQFDRIVDRKLGAGADGEMGCVGSVAHQHDMGIAVEMAPLAADQPVEIQPCRTAQVPRIGHQLGAFQHFGKEPLAEVYRALLVHLTEVVLFVGLFGRFDDEG
ncbi:hypothetical protein D3C71_1681230 [compost metagenome]